MLSTGLAAAAALLVAVAPRLPRLRERYDTAALQPITGQPLDESGPAPLDKVLQDWVMDGAGSGATLLPWHFPAAPRPLACAIVSPTQRQRVHAFGYRLAGYHQLDTRSRLGGIAYRIGVQLRPLLWFLPRRNDEPWDDAWLTNVDEPRLAALARWQPRRPTLIVLDSPVEGAAARVMDALQASLHRNLSQHPVRLLILHDGDLAEMASTLTTQIRVLPDQRNG
ncbi:hypothetical protein [Zoogloea sp.]|uniref:hypothetical protein n=1 Tax=Zoogloea sp. TaxID=49181 RepID=UPI0035B4AD40